jgi:hypothetical protein
MALRSRIWTLIAAGSMLAGCSSSNASIDGPRPSPDAAGSAADTSATIGVTSDGAAGDAAGPPADGAGATGTALAKFCNGLSAMGAPTEITVEIGDTAPVRLTAVTGTCSSMLGQMCQTVPAGVMETLNFFQGDQMVGTAQSTIMPGEELVLLARLNAMGRPVIAVGVVSRQGLTCAAFDAFAVPDGGAPADGGGDRPPADGGAGDTGIVDARSN